MASMAQQPWEEELEGMAQQAEGSFWGYLGCELIHAGEDKTVVGLTIKPHHLNMLGILHGGVHAALLDSAMGLAAMTAMQSSHFVTSGMHIHYTAPVGSQRVLAEAKVVHHSKRTVTTEGKLWAEEEGGDRRLCAITTASYQAVKSGS